MAAISLTYHSLEGHVRRRYLGGLSQEAVKRNRNKQPVGPGWLLVEILAALVELLLEQFAEHGVNIFLIANMLHGKVVETRL